MSKHIHIHLGGKVKDAPSTFNAERTEINVKYNRMLRALQEKSLAELAKIDRKKYIEAPFMSGGQEVLRGTSPRSKGLTSSKWQADYGDARVSAIQKEYKNKEEQIKRDWAAEVDRLKAKHGKLRDAQPLREGQTVYTEGEWSIKTEKLWENDPFIGYWVYRNGRPYLESETLAGAKGIIRRAQKKPKDARSAAVIRAEIAKIEKQAATEKNDRILASLMEDLKILRRELKTADAGFDRREYSPREYNRLTSEVKEVEDKIKALKAKKPVPPLQLADLERIKEKLVAERNKYRTDDAYGAGSGTGQSFLPKPEGLQPGTYIKTGAGFTAKNKSGFKAFFKPGEEDKAKAYAAKDSAQDAVSVAQAEKELAQHERLMRIMGDKASAEAKSAMQKKLAFLKEELAKAKAATNDARSSQQILKEVRELEALLDKAKVDRNAKAVRELEAVWNEMNREYNRAMRAEKGTNDAEPEEAVSEAIEATSQAMRATDSATKRGTRDNHTKAFVAHTQAALAWDRVATPDAKEKLREHEQRAHFHHSNSIN